MTPLDIVWFLLLPIPAFFAWTLVHEFAHVAMAAALLGLEDWEIKPYPHEHNRNLRFGGAYYTVQTKAKPWQRACISLAPRGPDLLAAICLPWAWEWGIPAVILVGAGLVDLAVGSIGWSKHSDLRRAARVLGVSAWPLRVAGFAVVVGSVFCSLV